MILCLVVTAGWMINTSDWQWREDHHAAAAIRTAFGDVPDDIGAHLHGPSTLVVSNIPPVLALWIEFFNKERERIEAEKKRLLEMQKGTETKTGIQVSS